MQTKRKLSPTAMGSTPELRSDDWATPPDVFKEIENALFPDGGFDVDVAASDDNHKVMCYFTKECDGLSKDWYKYGSRMWCNPPYSQTAAWLDKANEESYEGVTTACLVPNNTETAWFRKAFAEIIRCTVGYVDGGYPGGSWLKLVGCGGEVWFSPRRIQFIDPTPAGRSRNSRGSALFVFRARKPHPEDK